MMSLSTNQMGGRNGQQKGHRIWPIRKGPASEDVNQGVSRISKDIKMGETSWQVKETDDWANSFRTK